jgi:1-piperideine-2-carboxylate/1-pyrroline-2-carboxylate reductase [NAD(P)H]
MHFLDADATVRVLPYPELRDALLGIFARIADVPGECRCPPRTHIPLGTAGELMLLMAAADSKFAVTKVVTIHPANTPPTPTVQSDVVVTDVLNGMRLLQCNGNVVTQRRTSAVSIAALSLLLPKAKLSASLRVVIVGGGVQAQAHKDAIEACFATVAHEFRIFSRVRRDIEGAGAYDVTSEDAKWADVIITATASSKPVMTEDVCNEIRSDTVVCAVGAYKPTMAELPPSFVRRSRIVVDTVEGCESEAGDLLQAGIQFADVQPISAVAVASRAQAESLNTDQRPIVFKSVGSALWELAAAHCMMTVVQRK